MCIYGLSSRHEQLGDVWGFNIRRCEWKEVEYGVVPPSLQLHAAVVSEKDECKYVIGGKMKNETR